jgi:hypothetical protein
MTECDGCFYNRQMKAWGETFMACWYKHDTGQELYGSDECSGYEPAEKQLELELVNA